MLSKCAFRFLYWFILTCMRQRGLQFFFLSQVKSIKSKHYKNVFKAQHINVEKVFILQYVMPESFKLNCGKQHKIIIWKNISALRFMRLFVSHPFISRYKPTCKIYSLRSMRISHPLFGRSRQRNWDKT